MATVLNVDSRDFEEQVLRSEKPVLVDFWAEWCGPCRIMHPVLEQVAEEYDGKLKTVRLNVDENPDIAARYGVQAIPTFIIFMHGREVDRAIGAMPKSSLTRRLEKVIGNR